MEAFYYNHMKKEEQAVYHAMKSGITSLASSFAIPRLEGRQLSEIFFRLRLDCPEIFYVTGFHYRFYPDSTNVEMIPEYLFDKAKIKDHQKAMRSRVEKLARPAAGMSQLEKEQYIHDFICQNVHYDKLKKPYSHEIIGPLGQGVGVCEGIAKSVKILCDALGIWCVIAISDNNPEKQIRYRHAWNIVKIDGTYYHLDATFDNTLGRGTMLRYDYFNLGDERFFRDHEPVIYPVPSCKEEGHFYYKEKKLSFTKLEEVEKRAEQAAKKGRTFVFHWRGGYLTREILNELLSALERAGKKKEKHARVSLNWPQAVLVVNYEEALPIQQITLEEANEGEEESTKAHAEG